MAGPDSGFSWVIALCCSYIHFALFGLFRSAGVMYVAMLQNYDVTREEASWPFALCAAVFQLVGPLASVATHYVSQRKVCLAGSLVATVGVGACYFAHSVMWINVFYGLVHGLGFGFVVTVVPVILNQYFVRHRATALGLAFSGGTVSSLVFPSVMEWLLHRYSLRDSFLLLSGVVMNTLVASSLLREPPWLKANKKAPTTGDSDEGLAAEKASNYPKEYSLVRTDELPEVDSAFRDSMVRTKELQEVDSAFKDSLVRTEELQEVDLSFRDAEQDSCGKKLIPGGDFRNKDYDCQASNVNGGLSDLKRRFGSTETSNRCKSDTSASYFEGDSALFEASNGAANACVAALHTNGDSHKTELAVVKEPLLNDIGKKIVIVPKKTAEPFHEPRQQGFCHSIKGVLKEPMFHLITFTMAVYFLTVHSFFMVIVDFAKDKGIEESQAVYIISMFSLTDLFGRAGLGWVTDRNFITRKTMVALNLGVLGIVNQLYPLIHSLEGILAVSAVHGLAVGSSITLFFILLAECLGMDRLVLVVGMSSFINGVLSFLRPGIIGLFRDVIGTYDWMFHFLGFLSMVFSVMWLVESLRSRTRAASSKPNLMPSVA